MTDNPYAAPESPPQAPPLSTAARGIRGVSRAFRILGWTFFIPYLLMTVATVYKSWKSGLHTDKNFLLVSFISGTITVTAWMYIRIGRKLLTLGPRVYLNAMILSGLMVAWLFPLGILCAWHLRKYWKSYCEENFKIDDAVES